MHDDRGVGFWHVGYHTWDVNANALLSVAMVIVFVGRLWPSLFVHLDFFVSLISVGWFNAS
jgi:hypothetical protein